MSNSSKENMLSQQIRTWGKMDEKIVQLFASLDRAQFVAPQFQDLAYADMEIPTLHGEVMLSPVVQAKMLQALSLQPQETVLEVGTGNGFFTALLARQASHVISVEYHAKLQEWAAHCLAEVGCPNVSLYVGNAAKDWPVDTPVDVVVITGGLPFLPEAFKKAVRPGGRIVSILGQGAPMEVTLTVQSEKQWRSQKLFETQVPLLKKALLPEAFVF